MPDALYAHTRPDRPSDEWEPLARHLGEVAAMAGAFAATFGGEELARTLGLLHDLGKASERFQAYLRGEAPSTDHSTAGAQLAHARYGERIGKLLAFAIAGHHAGLPDGAGAEGSTLAARLKKAVAPYERWQELGLALPASLSPPAGFAFRPDRHGFQGAFLTRMLFSCLVDADWLCTERFVNGGVEREAWPDLASLKPKLDAWLARKQAEADDTPVNRQRRRIQEHVRANAGLAPGLFSLTVPTGGGKTLISLAFALDHAEKHGLARVIYVIPFTSIVEQTAAVFREVLGEDAVLEHHSAFDPDKLRHDPEHEEEPSGAERQRQAAENWDAPVVVTTAVQFFESLFAATRGRCRKLHNIANSVVILDEAQTLPLHLLLPCVAAIDELARNYRASIVLMTATQPALREGELPGGLAGVRELAPEGLDQEPAFRRVRIAHAGPLADDVLAERLAAERQALCIVNVRRHARELYEAIREQEGAFHLSTLMCAAHRSAVLATIRERLQVGAPVRLVATSLIEAGVDISFPLVLRAEAGLDQIAQAAGRCNREGELGEALGRVETFESPERRPPPEIAQRAAAGRAALRRMEDPLSSAAVALFFRELYRLKGEPAVALDPHGIMVSIDERTRSFDFPFATVAGQFRMIEDVMVPIIVPWDDEAHRLARALEYAPRIGGLLRRLQRYTVGVPRRVRAELIAAGAVVRAREPDFSDQLAVLANMDLYRPDIGLTWNDPSFMTASDLMF
ncbi:CRISPR-associated helicase Cas3' [Benzoatithermus flavus]|uniref:CRISPR-associated helicase Cas3 n=1 Tax=Benzoatithermus flavus TaxID=3108223 RepID=A0ABU8XQI8_9PROT